MKKKFTWLLVSSLMVLSLVIASCGPAVVEEEEEEAVVVEEEEEEEEAVVVEEEEEEEVVPTRVVPWWKKDPTAVPEYGGTFTYTVKTGPITFDPNFGSGSHMKLWMESVGRLGWTEGIDPETWDFKPRFTPMKYFTGGLAESWEIPDWQTLILHIRKGVHWQNIPPVNGRELTARDVEFNFHRLMGLGSGYTEPTPYVSTRLYQPMVSATATDKYTCVLKWSEPTPAAMRQVLDDVSGNSVVPPETVELYGNARDWRHAIGTGPFILKDFVAGSSITTVRNPDYWGYDKFYPENRLPYVDKVKVLIIADMSTLLAALRTGRVDRVDSVDWEQAESLVERSPELVRLKKFEGACFTIVMPVDREPWSDIRVRKAMQMSIDRETIAKTYYGGFVPGTPVGAIGLKGYRAEYKDWPQEVKDAHAYNPEGAKKLLTEAGYPNGFKCRLTMSTDQDMELAQILIAYLSKINVDMELGLKERGAWLSFIKAGKAELCTPIWANYNFIPPMAHTPHFTPGHYERAYRHIDDPVFNELNAKICTSIDEEEQMKLLVEADMYIISKHWTLNILPTVLYTFCQPWVKRFADANFMSTGVHCARLWIDQDLKKAMGR